VETERQFSATGICTISQHFVFSFCLPVHTAIQSILSSFSALILLLNARGTFNFELIKRMKTQSQSSKIQNKISISVTLAMCGNIF